MIYYIEYSREQQKLLNFLSYAEDRRAEAQAHALQREQELSRLPGGLKCEIVILEADSEDTIRRTHSRYFGNVFNAEAFALGKFASATPEAGV